MSIEKLTKTKWDKERVLQDALVYTSRYAWRKSSYGYEAASRNGWLEEACAHMTDGKGLFQKGYWTLETCIEDAKKHQTKSSWRYSEIPNGFNVVKQKGWLVHYCDHTVELKKANGYWSNLDHCLTGYRYPTLPLPFLSMCESADGYCSKISISPLTGTDGSISTYATSMRLPSRSHSFASSGWLYRHLLLQCSSRSNVDPWRIE